MMTLSMNPSMSTSTTHACETAIPVRLTSRSRAPRRSTFQKTASRRSRSSNSSAMSHCRRTGLEQPVPGPPRDEETVGNVVGRVVVPGHGGGRGPAEVVVQHLPQTLVAGQAGVDEGLVEAADGPLVH